MLRFLWKRHSGISQLMEFPSDACNRTGARDANPEAPHGERAPYASLALGQLASRRGWGGFWLASSALLASGLASALASALLGGAALLAGSLARSLTGVFLGRGLASALASGLLRGRLLRRRLLRRRSPSTLLRRRLLRRPTLRCRFRHFMSPYIQIVGTLLDRQQA